MPSIEGLLWLPRRYPKQQSLVVDWQAISQLIFLSKEQVMSATFSDNQNAKSHFSRNCSIYAIKTMRNSFRPRLLL